MSFTSEVRAKAQERLDRRRQYNEWAADGRRDHLFQAHPDFQALYREHRSSVAALNRIRFQMGPESAEMKRAQARAAEAKEAWRVAMAGVGLSPNDLDIHYSCPTCKDKGWLGVSMCQCLRTLCVELQTEMLSKRLDIKGQSFEAFDFRLYSSAPDPVTGISPLEQMRTIRSICEQFAEEFGAESRIKNLLLTGQTGLGKTFLSTCIANRVSCKGFSVVYDTAGGIFSAFEAAQFDGRSGEGAEARAHMRRCFDCDLLILDDLGCELTTKFVTKGLYDIVNERWERSKQTIMSTNLSTAEIGHRYSPAIASRIMGYYMPLLFFGDDIRVLRASEQGVAG